MVANDLRHPDFLEDPQRILERISDGFFALDEELRVTYFNRAAEELLRKSREEVVGRYLFDAFPEARGSVFEENYRAAVREKKAMVFETYFAPFDEWYEVRTSPNPTGINVYFLVITDRKRAEQSLRESEEALRTVFDSVHDAILLHTSDGAIVDFNRKFLQMYDVGPGEVVRLTIPDLFDPSMPLDSLQETWQQVLQGREQLFDWRGRRYGDGSTFPVEVFLRRVRLKGRELILATVRDIAERKRKEELIRRSEQRYRSLFNSIEEGFALCENIPAENGRGADFLLREANPAFERMTSGGPGQVAGRRLRELIPSLQDFWTDICGKIMRTGEPVQAVRRFAETGRWFEIHGFPHEDGIALLFSDITERKLAEDRTSELLGQMRAIFDHIPMGIAYLDSEFRFLSVNRFFCELVSLKEEQLIGLPCYEAVGEYVADESRKGLKKVCSFCKHYECLRTKSPAVIERPLDDRVLRVQTVPEFNEERGITRFLEIVEDITARKRLEDSLREGERRFREMIEALPQLVWTTDGRGAGDYLSRQWVEYTGLAAEEQLGDQWLEVVHPEDRPKTWELWSRFLRGETDYDLEYRLRRADGEYRWFKVRGLPIHDQAGRIIKIFGTCTDIDDKIRAEESLRQLGAELQRSNSELEQFARLVSHDLREPLRTIAGFLNLIRKRCTGTDPEAEKFIHYAVDGANRLDQMIRDLLEYSRIQRQEITFQPQPLAEILRLTTENLRFLIEESNAQIIPGPLPEVRGDAGQLTSLLQNLIANAITYRGDQRPEIRIRAAAQGDQWRISVQDNGIGIESAYLERIFQVFQRLHTRKEYPGTGIGLAICKKIVERHHGRIWVESEPGKGSTFHFTLPKA
jgi:PAS domain S-box-containing protein